MPRFSVPNTSVIASTGQAARQAPWPMHDAALISTALPPMMPSASSGQAVTHEPEPMQRSGSITGCSDGGSSQPGLDATSFSCSTCSRSMRRLRRR